MDLTAHQVEVLKTALRPYEVEYYGADEVLGAESWETTDPDDKCGAIKLSLDGEVVRRFRIPAYAVRSDDTLRAWAASLKPAAPPLPRNPL